MKVAITQFEREVLLKYPETRTLTGKLLGQDDSTLDGSGDQCDDLREACAEVLMRVGFDETYSPTPEGVALEALIDKLYSG